jgi:hypothetical protein
MQAVQGYISTHRMHGLVGPSSAAVHFYIHRYISTHRMHGLVGPSSAAVHYITIFMDIYPHTGCMDW